METLRRATVYALLPTLDRTAASQVRAVTFARELLSRLKARVPDSGVKSEKATTAMALFDYGYLIESYKQTGPDSQGIQLADGVDGYGIMVKAIGMRGGDPEMEFAVALAKWDRNGSHLAHLQRSIAGAPEGSLLARNLVSHFNNLGKTIAELRANVAKN